MTHPHRIFSIYGRSALLAGAVSVLVCLPIRAGEQPAEVARGTSRLTLQDQSFVEAYRCEELSLNQRLSSGVRVFSLEGATGWQQAATDETQSVRLTVRTPTISGVASLHLKNTARTPFQLYSTTRFDVPTEGIVIIAFGRTLMDSCQSIYSVSDNRLLERPHLLKTAAWPTPVCE